jgi:Bacterial Ig-like domain (group 1)/Divergent InlB B-repeat domain
MRPAPERSLALVAHRAGLIATVAFAGLALGGCSSSPTTNTTKAGLNIAASGTGSGTVTASSGGLSCQMTGTTATGTCFSQYDAGVVVTLTAAPAQGSTFAGWTGGCSGSVPTCAVTMTATTNVQANFAAALQQVAVALSGSGDGTVVSSPAGVSCTRIGGVQSGSCSAAFGEGSSLLLTATPATQQFFGGWGGACAGSTATCTVAVSAAVAIQAAFLAPRTVTVTAAGSGSGSVTSVPAGINCTVVAAVATGTCSAMFADGAGVALTAVPAAQQFFGAWSGGCIASAGSCSFAALSSDVSAQVTLLAPRILTVLGAGVGAGIVTSAPAGVNCSIGAGVATGSCAVAFPDATAVVLTASPTTGSSLAAWSGACSGVACVLAMTSARSVTAAFSGASSASQSTVVASPTTFIAGGGSSTITVTAKDPGGVPLAGVGVALSFTGPVGMVISQPGSTTNASGVATGSVTATTAGTYVVSATINGTTAVAQQATITVTPAAASSIAQVGAFNTAGARFGLAVLTMPAVVVRDPFGNAVPGVTVTFAVTKGLSTIGNGSTTSGASLPVVTDATGMAQLSSWTLASVTTAGNYSATIDVNNTVLATAAGVAGNVPFATAVDVSYSNDVQAIWDATSGPVKACSASGCHANPGNAPVLALGLSRTNLTANPKYWTSGDSTAAGISSTTNVLLYRLVLGAPIMPQGYPALPANVVGIIKAYIRQGVPNN